MRSLTMMMVTGAVGAMLAATPGYAGGVCAIADADNAAVRTSARNERFNTFIRMIPLNYDLVTGKLATVRTWSPPRTGT